eukprot:Em0008g260a
MRLPLPVDAVSVLQFVMKELKEVVYWLFPTQILHYTTLLSESWNFQLLFTSFRHLTTTFLLTSNINLTLKCIFYRSCTIQTTS